MYACIVLQLLGKKGLALLSLESRESDGFVILHFLTSSAIQIVIDHVLNGLMQVADIMCLLPFCLSWWQLAFEAFKPSGTSHLTGHG